MSPGVAVGKRASGISTSAQSAGAVNGTLGGTVADAPPLKSMTR